MEHTQKNVADNQHEEAVQPQETHSTPEVEAQSKELSDKERNFIRLRETKEHLEKENRELKNAIQRQALPTGEPKDEDIGISDDDLVEGKHYKKLHREIENLKKSYEQERLSTIPERLKNKFSDFDQVVTQENIEKLKISEPEVYASITSGSDLYAKGVSAYKTLKALGIVEDDLYSAKKEQVQRNSERPISAQAVRGQGALSEANIFAKGLTPELRKQLQQEMAQAIKAR
jgi:predicted RNase H-like nuclease (RuvC/YqgF family)